LHFSACTHCLDASSVSCLEHADILTLGLMEKGYMIRWFDSFLKGLGNEQVWHGAATSVLLLKK
jgi:hypothetical protein